MTTPGNGCMMPQPVVDVETTFDDDGRVIFQSCRDADHGRGGERTWCSRCGNALPPSLATGTLRLAAHASGGPAPELPPVPCFADLGDPGDGERRI